MENENSGASERNFADFADFAGSQFEYKNDTQNFDIIENSPTLGSWVYENLPELLNSGCDVLETERQKDVFLTGALTVLSGCFNSVTGIYDRKRVQANLFSFIVAPPANDKGILILSKRFGENIHNFLLKENEVERKTFKAEYAKYKLAAKKEIFIAPPVEPSTKLLFIPANSSSAAIMKHISDNNGGGIIFETEADTLTNTFKQDWGNFDDVLRKAFHQETISFSRKTNNEFVEINRPKLAVVLSGTPGQLSKLIESSENGLFSRFLFYYYKTPAVWHDVSPKNKINYDDHFQQLSERVYKIYAALKDMSIDFEFTLQQWNNLHSFFAPKMQKADEYSKSTLIRLGLVVFKISMILTILRNENNMPTDGKLICKDYDQRIAFNLTNLYEEHADIAHMSLLVPKPKTLDITKNKFFNSLPDGTPVMRKDAVRLGKALNISERQVDNYLKLFQISGMLSMVKYGVYQKA